MTPVAGRRIARRLALAGFVALALAALPGCASIGYYWQAANGHLAILNAARPVPDWIADPATPEPLKARLVLAQKIREFAAHELHLPDNASYRRYADLGRPAAVWNVVATPVDSLTLETWCFPVTGCVGYRGYYDRNDALALARELDARGLETAVYPVPAYSTLGWSNWFGGDPLLSTFISYPEGELARIIFHELAHQVVYAKDDTAFNESFATAVERLGSQRWLAREGAAEARDQYARFDARRQQYKALLMDTRAQLSAAYADTSLDHSSRIARKEAILAGMRQRYAALKAQWGGFAGYDASFARTNNALLATQAAYDEFVPDFEALFERLGHDWVRFHAEVQRLSHLPREQRRDELRTGRPTAPR